MSPGLYRGNGLELSFDRAGGIPVLQIGSPVLRYARVPWWQSASVVAPAGGVAIVLALAGVLGWPIAIIRRARHPMDGIARRLRWTTRLALLLDLTAVACALWLVFSAWYLVAVSSAIGRNVAIVMYAAAWTSVLLTPFVVWHAYHLAVCKAATRWLRGREYLLVLSHLLLIGICLQWRIAGATLAF